MSEQTCMEELLAVLVEEERKLHNQIVHFNGQLAHNKLMQEVCNDRLRDIAAIEANKPQPKSSRKTKK